MNALEEFFEMHTHTATLLRWNCFVYHTIVYVKFVVVYAAWCLRLTWWSW